MYVCLRMRVCVKSMSVFMYVWECAYVSLYLCRCVNVCRCLYICMCMWVRVYGWCLPNPFRHE